MRRVKRVKRVKSRAAPRDDAGAEAPVPLTWEASFSQALPDVPIDIAKITPLRSMSTVVAKAAGAGGTSSCAEVWTMCKDGAVVIRDPRTGDVLHALQLAGAFARCVTLVEEHREVWVGYTDALIRIFGADEPYRYNGTAGAASNLAGPVGSLLWTGLWVASGMGDGVVCGYEPRTRRLAWRCVAHTALVRSLATHRCADGEELLITGSDDATMAFWAVENALADAERARAAATAATASHPSPRKVGPLRGAAATVVESGCGSIAEHVPVVRPAHMFKEASVVRCVLCDAARGVLWVGTEGGVVRALDLANLTSVLEWKLPRAGLTQLLLRGDVLYVLDGSQKISCRDLRGPGETFTIRAPTPASTLAAVADARITSMLVADPQASTGFVVEQRVFGVPPRPQRQERCVEARKRLAEALASSVKEQRLRVVRRQEPPRDVALEARLQRTASLKESLVRIVRASVRVSSLVADDSTRRIFYALWKRRTAARIFRVERERALRHLYLSTHAHLRRSAFATWLRWRMARHTRRAHVAAAAVLASSNEARTISARLATWRAAIRPSALVHRAARLAASNGVTLGTRFWCRWRRAARTRATRAMQNVTVSRAAQLVQTRYESARASCFARWQAWLGGRRTDKLRRRAMNAIAVSSAFGTRLVCFRRWIELVNAARRGAVLKAAHDALFGASKLYVRRQCFATWRRFVLFRHREAVKAKAVAAFARVTARCLCHLYFDKLRRYSRRHSKHTPASRAELLHLLRALAARARRSTSFVSWRVAARHGQTHVRGLAAMQLVLSGSDWGRLRLAFAQWRSWPAVSRVRAQRRQTQLVLSRLCRRGVERVYLEKWRNIVLCRRHATQRRATVEIMATFSTTMIRSRVFQRWLARTVLKSRLTFLLKSAQPSRPSEVVARYFDAWQSFAMAAEIRRGRALRERLAAAEQRLSDTQAQQASLTEQQLVEKGRCLVSVAHGAELRHTLDRLNDAIGDLELRKAAMRAQQHGACRSLKTAAAKLARYKEAGGQSVRPVVPVVGDWHAALRNFGRHVRSIDELIQRHELGSREVKIEVARLRVLAEAARADIVESRETHLRIPDASEVVSKIDAISIDEESPGEAGFEDQVLAVLDDMRC